MPSETEQHLTSVQLLDVGTRNDQFNRNLSFFKLNHDVIYKKIIRHQYTYFQLCLNPDKSFNILDLKKKSLLYPTNDQDFINYDDEILKNIKFEIHPITGFLGNTDKDRRFNQLMPLKAKFHQSLFDAGNLNAFFDKTSHSYKDQPTDLNFLPLLRIYGLGLGHHIINVLKQYDISCLIIHEPEYDLFYTSLYTVPWDDILNFFMNDPNRHCLLSTDSFKISIQSEESLLKNLHPFAYSSQARLNASNGRDFSGLIELENHYDRSHFVKKAAGCYQDQVTGFKNTLLNIKQNMPFYNGKKQNKRVRVFLVGSGPSLNDSIHYLKQHQDKALVIACGSALSALVKNNIIPDIHIWQERHISQDYLLQYADCDTYKKIMGIRLNVVDSDIDSLYSDTFIIQKANDPGSTILPLKNYPLSYNVNPTVTNCGIALCPIIGASEVFLFGLDYGSSAQRTKVHADDTFVLVPEENTVDQAELICIPGNFSQAVYANADFVWSRNNTENEIAYAKHIKWINIGDGALIQGTTVKKVEDLDAKLSGHLDKFKIKKAIKGLFDNHYLLKSVQKQIMDVHIPATQDFLIAMLDCFDSTPQDRCGIMTMISLIVKAASDNDDDAYLPKKLFGIEFVEFLQELYIQVSLTRSDAEAIALFGHLTQILRDHIEEIYQDFLTIAQLINE